MSLQYNTDFDAVTQWPGSTTVVVYVLSIFTVRYIISHHIVTRQGSDRITHGVPVAVGA